MIVIVVGEAWLGIICPLKVRERQLRDVAGQETYRGAFLANLIHGLLFYDAEPWVFAVLFSAFGLLAVSSFVLASPRRPRRTLQTKQVIE